LVAASVLEDGVPSPVTLLPPAARSPPKIPDVIVLDVMVDATSLRVTVPVALGSVIVRSAVGSTAVSVVSLASLVEPSNEIPPLAITAPEIILFVRVCASVVPTTSPVTPWTPALVGSAVVPA
jgi:hypothetical protein